MGKLLEKTEQYIAKHGLPVYVSFDLDTFTFEILDERTKPPARHKLMLPDTRKESLAILSGWISQTLH